VILLSGCPFCCDPNNITVSCVEKAIFCCCCCLSVSAGRPFCDSIQAYRQLFHAAGKFCDNSWRHAASMLVLDMRTGMRHVGSVYKNALLSISATIFSEMWSPPSPHSEVDTGFSPEKFWKAVCDLVHCGGCCTNLLHLLLQLCHLASNTTLSPRLPLIPLRDFRGPFIKS